MGVIEAATEASADGRVLRQTLAQGGVALAYADVLAGWRDEATFRAEFGALLADAPFAAFLWETPPVTRGTLGRPYEHVLVESRALASMAPAPEVFRAQFAADRHVVTFVNLGGDALLVAPCPRPASSYPHLAAFVRTAPAEQQDAYWRAVAQALERELGTSRRWLSTSGLGVAWLHARVDERPKYYTHAPYRAGS